MKVEIFLYEGYWKDFNKILKRRPRAGRTVREENEWFSGYTTPKNLLPMAVKQTNLLIRM